MTQPTQSNPTRLVPPPLPGTAMPPPIPGFAAPASAADRGRRRLVGAVVAIVGTIICAGVAIFAWQRLSDPLRSCRTYVGKPDEVVYEEDKESADKLKAQSREYIQHPNPYELTQWPGGPASGLPLEKRCPALSKRGTDGPAVFVHELRNGTARKTIMILPQFPSYFPNGHFLQLRTYFLSLNRKGQFTSTAGNRFMLQFPRECTIRLFAGQIDPADASHFTIRYQLTTGPEGIFDGRLERDGAISMSVRSGVAQGTIEGPAPY